MDAEIELEEEFTSAAAAGVPQITSVANFNYALVALLFFVISYFLWKFFHSQSTHSTAHQSSAQNDAHRKAMENARAKLQEELNAQIAQYKSKKQEEDEIKAREKAEKLAKYMTSNGTSQKSTDDDKKKRLRPNDYNPLAGDSGTTYRPTSRFCSRGG
ncbi:unnamed protein product [Trichobilharzia szidati]|nr:unnamed protein product [Trichobilharzia szidati]CAH8823782.1 unnamed protein product [Trichobilharzia szidati]